MDGGEVQRLMPLALRGRALAELAEHDPVTLGSVVELTLRAGSMRALRRDDRGDRGDPERSRGDVIDDRAAAGGVLGARELRAEDVDQRQAAGERDPGVAIVRVEQVFAALEGEPGPGLYRFVSFGTHRDPDLALAVEL